MPALLWALLIGLGKLLLWLLGYLIIQAILLIGVSWVTYKGIDVMLGAMKAHIITLLGGSSEMIVNTLGLIKFDVFISIIFSAYAMKFIINGVNGITKMQWKGKFYKDI